VTPFGTSFRYLREERGLSQREMGRRLQLDSKIISALETGRRSPPSDEILNKIIAQLSLTQAEAIQLVDAARHSSYIVRIPREISPRELRLVHRFITTLGNLRPEQISAIQRAIEGGA
jgi:HTH-type transcriptional regulator, competence development regulator